MKRHAFATALSLLLMPALAPLYAQSLKFVVPFEFAAAQATLPAGEYRVSPNVPTQGMIRLSSANGSSNAICFASGIQSGSASDKAKLVFNRYGDRYFLSQVWSGGGNNLGQKLKPTKAEREIAQTMSRPETAILTASKEHRPLAGSAGRSHRRQPEATCSGLPFLFQPLKREAKPEGTPLSSRKGPLRDAQLG